MDLHSGYDVDTDITGLLDEGVLEVPGDDRDGRETEVLLNVADQTLQQLINTGRGREAAPYREQLRALRIGAATQETRVEIQNLLGAVHHLLHGVDGTNW